MDFVAIDVETANPDMASICQIGIAIFRNGVLSNTWKTYIDPEDYFDEINISIHGITRSTVKGAPNFQQIKTPLYRYLNNQIVVCHTHFDRSAIHQAAKNHQVSIPYSTWLDSAKVARRAWPDEFAKSGYGLANVADHIGYEFNHHDALEDAIAAGMVIMKAIEHSGLTLSEWVTRAGKPIGLDPITGHEVRRVGNPSGFLCGETIVFTGALVITRAEAADLASKIGCDVGAGVTKKTSILVVGDQDITKLAGKEKSSKHLKAEELILKGQTIRIIKESDFLAMIAAE